MRGRSRSPKPARFHNEPDAELTIRGASVLIESYPDDIRNWPLRTALQDRRIIAPETHAEPSRFGKVLQLGTGRLQDGRQHTFSVSVGDIVWCPRYPQSWNAVDKMHGIMKESEILAIVEVENG